LEWKLLLLLLQMGHGALIRRNVVAGLLIAIAWLTFVASLRRVTDRAFATGSKHGDRGTSGAPSETRLDPTSLAS